LHIFKLDDSQKKVIQDHINQGYLSCIKCHRVSGILYHYIDGIPRSITLRKIESKFKDENNILNVKKTYICSDCYYSS